MRCNDNESSLPANGPSISLWSLKVSTSWSVRSMPFRIVAIKLKEPIASPIIESSAIYRTLEYVPLLLIIFSLKSRRRTIDPQTIDFIG